MQPTSLLLRWPDDYQGPGWEQLVLRTATLATGIGIAILMLVLFTVSGAAVLALLFT